MNTNTCLVKKTVQKDIYVSTLSLLKVANKLIHYCTYKSFSNKELKVINIKYVIQKLGHKVNDGFEINIQIDKRVNEKEI